MSGMRTLLSNLTGSFWVTLATALFSSLLLWWVNAAWRADSLVGLEVLEHLRLARTEALRGYLLAERVPAGEEALAGNGRCAYFEQAAGRADDALAALDPMREAASFRNGYRRIAERLQAYRLAIRSLGGHACLRSGDPGGPMDMLEMGRDMAEAEKLYGLITSDIHARFRNRALLQDRYSTGLVVGWAGLMAVVCAMAGLAGVRRRQAEAGLRESEERFRMLVESASNAVFLQKDGRFAYANPACAALFGAADADGLLGLPILERLRPESRADVAERIRKLNEEGQASPWREETILRLDGTPVVVEVAAVPVRVGGAGGALVQMHDVTARKRAEEEMRAALAEKEMLLREVHHRVKNNLQIIISLMRLQGSDGLSQAEQERLARLEHRIRSMALIHGQLYQTGGLGVVDMGAYASALLAQLETAFNRGGGVRLETELDEVRVGIEKAVPLGLLMNELVTNAFKHAFAERGQGVLRVSLRRGGTEAALRVEDDGPGLSSRAGEAGESLGMLLMAALTDQLQGRMSWLPGGGARAEVVFPL